MRETWVEEALKRWRETRQPEALGELLKVQRNRAYAVAWHLTRSASDAEDAVQEAFVKLLSRTAGFEDAAAFDIAVYRAVVQCALDALRKRERRAAREVAAGSRAAPERTEKMASSETASEREELRVLLTAAVQGLPEEERVPVVLCYYQGLSVAETARTLELPRGTLRSRLARALLSLRRHLKRQRKSARHAAILALLWQEGVLAAPERLCATLDRVLPGGPCGTLPALAQPGPAAAPTLAEAWLGWSASQTGLLSTAAVLAVAALGTGLYLGVPSASHPSAAETSTVQTPAFAGTGLGHTGADSGVQATHAEESVGDSLRLAPITEGGKEEDESMKSKLAALALMGGLLAPGAVQAGEGHPDVAKAIAQIEARRSAKAEAEAKAAASYSERGERGNPYWRSSPSSAGQPGAGGPGGSVVIQER